MPALPATPLSAAPIEIVVTDVRGPRGHVRIEACPRESFLTDDCRYLGTAPAHAGTVTITIANVPPGRYALQAVHDENDNTKVDRDWIGIPKEGVGFSRDARICLGPPRFADAAFDHGGEAQRLVLRMRYRLC